MDHACDAAPVWKTIPHDLDPKQPAPAARPIHVLLVEDDPDAAALVRLGLEDSSSPFRVEWSPNLLGAKSRLTKPGVDAVLLDLGLPELKGSLSYRAIEAAADQQTPVVILTSDDRPNVRRLTMAWGASDFLVKGQSTPSQLKTALYKAVLNGRNVSNYPEELGMESGRF